MTDEPRYRFLWTVAIEREGGEVVNGGGTRNYGAGSTPQEALGDLHDMWWESRRAAGDALDEILRAKEQFENEQIAAIFGEEAHPTSGTAA